MSSFILKFVAVDKLLHFLISYSAVLTLYVLSHKLLLANAVTLAIGVTKEVLDSKQTGNYFSLGDLAADLIGMAAATAVLLLVG